MTFSNMMKKNGVIRASIAQHFWAKRIPKEIRDSYCVHCGHPKHYCACMMRYCPKCQRETMQHETLVGKVEAEPGTVVLASMIGMRTYAWVLNG